MGPPPDTPPIPIPMQAGAPPSGTIWGPNLLTVRILDGAAHELEFCIEVRAALSDYSGSAGQW
jgi:hypothetical protein